MGLDASKFDAAQKNSVEHLRKFDDANQKSSKQAQRGAKAMNDGFLKLKETLIQVGVAVVGINGVKDFLGQMVGGNAALGRTSQLLGMNARDLHAWGAVVKTVGGTQEGFRASMQNMEGALAGVKFGNTGILTTLSFLGAQGAVNVQKNTIDLIKLSDAIVKSKQRIGVQATFSLAKQLGLDEPTFQLLLKGPVAVASLHDQYLRLDGVTDANIQAAAELQGKWAKLQQNASSLGQSIFKDLIPALEKTLDLMTKIFRPTNLSAGASSIASGDYWNASFELPAKDFVKALALRVGGASDAEIAMALDKNLNMKSGGVPRGIRNNNPGNMRYSPLAKKYGATGEDNLGFAVFPTMKAGQAAMTALLKSYKDRGYNSITSIVGRWAPSTANDVGSYISDVSKRTGIFPNHTLTDDQYAAVQRAMAIHEVGAQYAGMVGAGASSAQAFGGGTTVQTHINAINVHTQATDADGIARDMHKSLQNNALIGAGMMAGS